MTGKEIRIRMVVPGSRRPVSPAVNFDSMLQILIMKGMVPKPDMIYNFWTGLKDKNDTEIYDRDIVRVTELDGEFVANLEVKWASNGYHLYKPDQIGWSRTLAYYEDKITVEVIGNIYENPELLEAQA